MDAEKVCAKWGISSTSQVIEVLTLCGDSSDNVPGVKGVGEKGASKLLGKYSTVENIYSHLDELSTKQKEKFEEAREYIKMSHFLVTIKTDVPVDTSLDRFKVVEEHSQKAVEVFKKYEFNSLLKHLHSKSSPAPGSSKGRISIDFKDVSPEEFIPIAKKCSRISLICNATGKDIFSSVKAITVCASDSAQGSDAKKSSEDNAVNAESEKGNDSGNSAKPEAFYRCHCDPSLLKEILEDASIEKVGDNLKLQLSQLESSGITLGGKLLDIGLMHYLIDPERSHKIESLSISFLGIGLEDDSAKEAEEEPKSLFDMADDGSESGSKSEEDAYSSRGPLPAVLLLLCERVSVLMKKTDGNLWSLYDNVEEPLVRVLSSMERQGVKVDIGQLRAYIETLRKETLSLEKEIRDIAEAPTLNVSSPKQVGDLLFEKMQLDPRAKKGKNGAYSTDEATLLGVYDKSPIVGKILEFRGAKKLLSTYIEPFPQYISPVDGKVHTTFNQTLTSTGRLSSSNPNIQNIPIREERGREIRKAFVPSSKDGLILSADYSQIELRIMAHLSCDAHLRAAFRNGQDIHAATASKIYGVPIEEVTREQRSRAKTANFGIMYGISAFGLSQRLRISRSEAKQLIDDYFAAFPAIKSYIDDTLASARETGYVETIFGRRRYVPDITSHNSTVRQAAERLAVNAPIQGTAADIMKMAMVKVDRMVREKGLESKMILQIHDELLFDTFPEEVETLRATVTEGMEKVCTLSIPLTVECNYGKNWLEAH